jgi:ribosomal protein S27E
MSQFSKHVQVKVKCFSCNLHFIICTWHPENHTSDKLTCPECGQNKGAFTMWAEEVSAPICTVVPGRAQLTGIAFPVPPEKT